MLAGYRQSAQATSAHWAKRVAALQALLRKHGAAHKDYERRVRSMGSLNSLIADVQAFDRRTAAWAALVQQLPAPPAAAGAALPTTSAIASLLVDDKELLERGLALGNAPCSKAMAFMASSVLDLSGSSLASLCFTPDQLKTWQLREMADRVIAEQHERGVRIIGVAADKAFAAANGWDLAGYPKTRTAAMREVEYFQKILPKSTGPVSVLVKHWPRTADLRAAAEALLRDPRAILAGCERQAWMDHVRQSQSRERWVDFLLQWDVDRISVRMIGIEALCTQAGLDMGALVDAPLNEITLPGRQELAETLGLA